MILIENSLRAQVQKKLGALWNALSEAEKQPFLEQAQGEKEACAPEERRQG